MRVLQKTFLCVFFLCFVAYTQVQAQALRVCTMPEDPPFTERTPTGEWRGFAIELWQALDIKEPYVFVAMDFPTALAGLEDGACDAVATNVSVTTPRRQRMLFSVPYMYAGLTAMMRKDTQNIRSEADLRGKTIATYKGSSSEQYIMDKIKNCVLLVLSSEKDLLNALIQKKTDVIIYDRLTLRRIAYSNSDFMLLDDDLYPQDYAYAFPKQATALRDAVSVEIERLQKDGTIRVLVSKWLDGSSQF